MGFTRASLKDLLIFARFEELQIICCRILQHLASLAPVEVAQAWPLIKAVLEAHENGAVHQAAWHVWELVALQDGL